MKFFKTIILLTAAIIFLPVHSFSQNTSTAVMEVSVEILSGSKLVQTNRSLQIDISTENQTIEYGSFNMSLSEGTDVLINVNRDVTMTDGKRSWTLHSSVSKKEIDGKIHFRVEGTPNQKVDSGHFEGQQVATIYYI